ARWGVVGLLAAAAASKSVLAFAAGGARFGWRVAAGLWASVAAAAGVMLLESNRVVPGIPIRSGKIIEELIDQLPWLLGDGIGSLLERLEEQLGENPASVFDQPDCCRQSQRILLYRRSAAQPALIDALRRRCLSMAEMHGDTQGD